MTDSSEIFFNGPTFKAKCRFCHYFNDSSSECIRETSTFSKPDSVCGHFTPEFEDKGINWVLASQEAILRVQREFIGNGFATKSCENCAMFPCGKNKNTKTEFCHEFKPAVRSISGNKVRYFSVFRNFKVMEMKKENDEKNKRG
jgi:hypothetical protein